MKHHMYEHEGTALGCAIIFLVFALVLFGIVVVEAW